MTIWDWNNKQPTIFAQEAHFLPAKEKLRQKQLINTIMPGVDEGRRDGEKQARINKTALQQIQKIIAYSMAKPSKKK